MPCNLFDFVKIGMYIRSEFRIPVLCSLPSGGTTAVELLEFSIATTASISLKRIGLPLHRVGWSPPVSGCGKEQRKKVYGITAFAIEERPYGLS